MRPCKGVQWSWATTRDVFAAVPLAGRYGYLLGPNSFHFLVGLSHPNGRANAASRPVSRGAAHPPHDLPRAA